MLLVEDRKYSVSHFSSLPDFFKLFKKRQDGQRCLSAVNRSKHVPLPLSHIHTHTLTKWDFRVGKPKRTNPYAFHEVEKKKETKRRVEARPNIAVVLLGEKKAKNRSQTVRTGGPADENVTLKTFRSSWKFI